MVALRRTLSSAPLVLLVLAALALLAPATLALPRSNAADSLAALALQQAELTASDGAAYDYFGMSVALSGGTALVGADTADNSRGAAYVFTRSGAVWSRQQKLTASDGAESDSFGTSVALSGDTALVGAAGVNPAAYVFTRTNGIWSQQKKLTVSEGASYFGERVALSGDTALIGDRRTNDWQGAAYVFTRSGTVWSRQQKLTASDGVAFDWFGASVALSGETALVGASGAGSNQGAAYVFTRSGTVWTQQGKLTASDAGAIDSFGASVALSAETALVGADSIQGGAYVFTRLHAVWTQQQKLPASATAADNYFGHSVALSGDMALVGLAAGTTDKGAAYVFTRSDAVWTQQQKLTASDGAANDEFGASVALSGDTALVGAPFHKVAGKAMQGATYVFVMSSHAPSLTKLSPTSARRGATVTLSGRSFGKKGSRSYVKVGATKCTKYISWSATRIRCKVPAKTKSGKLKVVVVTAGGTSNAKTLTVKR